MRLNRFYHAGDIKINEVISLERSVATHIVKVLRMSSDDKVILFNGDGYDYSGQLMISNRNVSIKILDKQQNQTLSPVNTHLGQAICRADRMDYSIQKAVEMGVSEISPVITDRVQFRIDTQRQEKKMRHWQGVIISACEQSGRADIPALHSPCSLDDWLIAHHGSVITLDPAADIRLGEHLLSVQSEQRLNLALLIGPEGGLTDDELLLCREHGSTVSLGPRILRTETAGTACLALVQLQLGDL